MSGMSYLPATGKNGRNQNPNVPSDRKDIILSNVQLENVRAKISFDRFKKLARYSFLFYRTNETRPNGRARIFVRNKFSDRYRTPILYLEIRGRDENKLPFRIRIMFVLCLRMGCNFYRTMISMEIPMETFEIRFYEWYIDNGRVHFYSNLIKASSKES